MAVVQFGRYVKVNIATGSRPGGITIDKLYMTFNINKSVSDEDTSPSTFEIYNPSLSIINEIKLGNGITVEAGYIGPARQVGNIFSGAITDKKRDRRRQDRVVVLEMLSTPVINLTQNKNVISLEYPTPVPLTEVIAEIAKALGVTTDQSVAVFAGLKTYEKGSSYIGVPQQLLFQLCNSIDISYAVDGGVLRFRKSGETTDSSTGLGSIVINRDTPIVGDPEIIDSAEDDEEKPENVSIEAQLSAVYDPGRSVTIQRALLEETSFEKGGDFVITKVNHTGSNIGGKFSSRLILERAA